MPKPHEAIPLAVLPELLEYNPKTGELRWLERETKHFTEGGRSQSAEQKCKRWNARFAGKIALQQPNAEGYRHGRIFGIDVQTHRIAWAIYHGEWPKIIDHINGDRLDNRISNLRSVSASENCRNAAIPNTNKSGAVGVFQRKRGERWIAAIRIGNGKREIKYFDNFNDAVAARKEAEQRHGYHPNHGREQSASAA